MVYKIFLFGSKAFFAFQLKILQLLLLFVVLGPSLVSHNALAQQTPRRPLAFPTLIDWNKQRGFGKYRLQIAADERFQNIFYDGHVTGVGYVVRGIAPGYYYWRIAPATSQTGGFSKPVRFFVSGGFVVSSTTPKKGGRSRLR
jgi:hypothetical protein